MLEQICTTKEDKVLHIALESLSKIVEFHTKFFEVSGKCLRKTLISISKGMKALLITLTAALEFYCTYAENYENLQKKLLTKDSKVAKTLATLEKSTDNLFSSLICPLARIPRYFLLTSDLIKHANEDHPLVHDLTFVMETLRRMSQKFVIFLELFHIVFLHSQFSQRIQERMGKTK